MGQSSSATVHYTPSGTGAYRFTVLDSEMQDRAHSGFAVNAPTRPRRPPPEAGGPAGETTLRSSRRLHDRWRASGRPCTGWHPRALEVAAITGYQVMKGTTVRNLTAGYRSSLFTRLHEQRSGTPST